MNFSGKTAFITGAAREGLSETTDNSENSHYLKMKKIKS